MYSDSFDKIVRSYFAAVTSQTFTYGTEVFQPKDLRVSSGIFRGYTCPEGCGGCCMRFSLVYLPSEPHPYPLMSRAIEFNGHAYALFEDAQTDHESHSCRNLNQENGRCNIHGQHPFTCDFELLRVTMHTGKALLNQRLFGRGWAMKRVDGERGAMCEMLPPSDYWRDEAVRKLYRLQVWTDYFEIETRLPLIIRWVETGPHDEPLWLHRAARPLEAVIS